MNITIFGTGYVGLVTGTCFAEVGHHVLCMDVDAKKIDNLNQGVLPIWEPGLEAMVLRNVAEGQLKFSTDMAFAVAHGQVQFIAVGTPADEDGSADLKYVLDVALGIGQHMLDYKVVVNKSTVPVGSADKVAQVLHNQLSKRSGTFQSPTLDHRMFDVVSNPEFLKEGTAINDFMKPERIVIGVQENRAKDIMRELYEPFTRNHDCTLFMDLRSAELTKYAANAMLATKISFMNEMANLAERLGVDIEDVRKGIGSDPRIGYHFIYPGCGYGGSCFPKDVEALVHTAKQVGYEAQLLNAVEAVNKRQKNVLFDKLAQHFGGVDQLYGKTIAVWGLAFKPNTDDMRAAPSRTLMESLWKAGAKVQAYDPAAKDEAARIYDGRSELKLVNDKYAALQGADALAICTEWHIFLAPDFDEMQSRLVEKTIVDGRNLFSPQRLRAEGWAYYCVGRS